MRLTALVTLGWVVCLVSSVAQGQSPQDIEDLGALAVRWLADDCVPLDWCEGLDMDRSGGLDQGDFGIMSANWQADCAGDSDCDGVSDAEELARGSDPCDPDSDDDGLTDGEETNPNGHTGSTVSTIKDAGGNAITSVRFAGGGVETVYVDVPVWADALEYVIEATMTLSGQADPCDPCSYPADVMVDVGGDWVGWNIFETGVLEWSKPLVRIDNYARGSGGAMYGDDGFGQTFKLLKTADIRGFAVLMEFFTAGTYLYGIQDSGGSWLTGFPETMTVSGATGSAQFLQFPFSSPVTLTRGTEYFLVVVEQTNLGASPMGFAEMVENPYPYGRMYFGPNHSNPGWRDTLHSPPLIDLAFHVYEDFTGSATTYDLSAGFNLYLASHNGPYVNTVTVPVDIHSATAGVVSFSNVTVRTAIVTTDAQNADSDGDTLLDGWGDTDGDQVFDAGETKGEQQYATNPAAADTDGDGKGLDDYQELNNTYDMTLPTGGAGWHRANPLRPDLLVEVDAMSGYAPTDVMMFETQKAYDALGVTMRYRMDNTSMPPAAINTDTEEQTALYNEDDYSGYVHVIFARDRSSGIHGRTSYAMPNTTVGAMAHGNNPDPRYAGSFVFRKEIIDDYNAKQSHLNSVGINLDLLTAKTVIHEIGHAIGCVHETGNFGTDYYNVMIQNSWLGDPDTTIDRWEKNVLGPDGSGPRFSSRSADQMDLDFKASVDVSFDPTERGYDFGQSSSAIYTGYHQALISHNYNSGIGYGWVVGAAPDTASLNSSSPSSNRVLDMVEHSTQGSAVNFRVGGLGKAQLYIYVRMGKGRQTPLVSDLAIRARVLGSVSTNFETETIFAPVDSTYLNLDWPNYPIPFDDATVIIDFTDDGSTDPVPIEYITVTKRGV